jgi:hypothetical protein
MDNCAHFNNKFLRLYSLCFQHIRALIAHYFSKFGYVFMLKFCNINVVPVFFKCSVSILTYKRRGDRVSGGGG